LFSYSGENTLPVNKMSQTESQINSYYELSISQINNNTMKKYDGFDYCQKRVRLRQFSGYG